MNKLHERHEKNINHLKEDIKALESLQADLPSLKEKKYDQLVSGFDESKINRKLMFLKATLEVYEYLAGKLGEEEYMPLGQYLDISFWMGGGDQLLCDICFKDDLVGKLYNRVFGSYSGINEFTKEHIYDMLSVILGGTAYSHAFNVTDLNDMLRVFERFGHDDTLKDCYHYRQEEFDKDVVRAKGVIDILFGLSQSDKKCVKAVREDFDKFIGAFLEGVFDTRIYQ